MSASATQGGHKKWCNGTSNLCLVTQPIHWISWYAERVHRCTPGPTVFTLGPCIVRRLLSVRRSRCYGRLWATCLSGRCISSALSMLSPYSLLSRTSSTCSHGSFSKETSSLFELVHGIFFSNYLLVLKCLAFLQGNINSRVIVAEIQLL